MSTVSGKGDRRGGELRPFYVAGAFSAIATLLIYVFLWDPIKDRDFGSPPGWELIFLLPILLGAVAASVWLVVDWLGGLGDWFEGRLLWVAAALALPIIALAIWAIWLRPAHAIQDEALAVWKRYTARMPPALVADPFINDRDGKYVTMCGGQRPPPYFCLEILTSWPSGKQVVGGFKAKTIEDVFYGEPGSPVYEYEPYDCFGDAIVCER